MCPSSPVCGPSTLFMEKHANLSVEFTNPQQVCVYKIYFHEVDPLDMIPDVVINIKKFENVKAELYSKVEKSTNNTYFKELEFKEVNHYYQNIENPEEEKGVDTTVYIVITPNGPKASIHLELENLQSKVWYLSIGFIASLICCCCFWGFIIYFFCIKK